MGFWAFSGEHFMDRGEPMFLSNALYKPKRIVSYESAPAVSPDIDRLPATLDIILQTSGTKRVLAHAVRFPKMSVESLAKLSYPAYLDYRNAMQRMIPSFSGSGRQLVWVPIYCAYQAQLMGDQLMTWTLSSLKPSPFIIGDASGPSGKKPWRRRPGPSSSTGKAPGAHPAKARFCRNRTRPSCTSSTGPPSRTIRQTSPQRRCGARSNRNTPTRLPSRSWPYENVSAF
jgi:hypothetical protein